MNRSVSKQLVHSFVEFLRSELAQGETALGAEAAESVEVALQCLETAYNLPASPAPNVELYAIFSEALNRQCVNSSIPQQQASGSSTQLPTDEDKARAEQLKAEGNARMKEGDFAASIQSYTQAIEKDPHNAVYYCNRAAAHSKLENHNAAIEDCKKALNLEPNYSKAYGRMGLAYSNVNKLTEARDCYKRALELEPENESYASNLSIAEEALAASAQQPANPLAGLLSGGGGLAGLAGAFNSSGAPDLSGFLANPALMNVATQLMSDPNMQNMMTNILSSGVAGGGGAPAAAPSATSSASATAPPPAAGGAPAAGGTGGGFPDMSALLNAGRQLAEQMQSQHPELLSQLRSQMGDQQPPSQQRPPQS
ncbi:hypothetical protein HAZT_HAZT004002 [Hyalella azteca]|uniref:Small glutamine-rich tetratricopeptide repeat-containing protein alpha-like n=1 Tax=Hyalella azteca TaxID=294128 RepID=A0A6A0GS25_HYAAZ|nr:small glutamine-rich tetratricopeptide repeat-containing protein alpha-like [Hyalella azteca]KAA0184387.1 hypothetical protein HAZT_HAZT004002 [Hyalella azteca]